VVHSTSRSSLRSCSHHQHLLISSHSLSGFFSSSPSSGNLDHRSNLEALSSIGAWSYELQSAERSMSDMDQHPNPRNTAVRRSKSGPSCDAPYTSTASPPIPVGSLPLMPRYYPLPSQSLESSVQSITTSLIRSISTTHTSSLPSIRIDHVELSQQVQRKSLSRAAQRKYESDVQRARSESLAALTAVHPGSCRHRHVSPLSLDGPRQASVFTSQHALH
jgi:hypothetical protein